MQGTEGMFQLLLSHNPTHWRREVLPQSQIDLMLAGHTHAMQMALGHHSPSSFVYPEWSGMYSEEGRNLYVNVGLGFVGLPLSRIHILSTCFCTKNACIGVNI